MQVQVRMYLHTYNAARFLCTVVIKCLNVLLTIKNIFSTVFPPRKYTKSLKIEP